MVGLGCCIWWSSLGVLIGFLAYGIFDRLFRRGGASELAAREGDLARQRAEIDSLRRQVAAERETAAAASAKLAASENIAAAARFGFAPKNPSGDDDLSIVEGIGPKIAGLLRDQGILTFAQLAQTPVERLVKILADAGPRFKIANHPDTWPRQADMCARGAWSELRDYQDVLVDGVDRRSKPGSGESGGTT
ncbi:MAG TPA: helix-hairpin-helix domain-containing protein [Burkholderiaceae bacterium]|nr:helix-hairpin-helix domain-containing protein [Burkholderiaceae bacterium]